MNMQRRNLKIAFGLVSPENVIENLKNRTLLAKNNSYLVDLFRMSRNYYVMTSRKLQDDYSIDELNNLYDGIQMDCSKYNNIPKSLFQLLVGYGEKIFELDNMIPIIKRSKLMGFRAISLDLGQDIFTTSYLAYNAFIHRIPSPTRFDWNTTIDTNDFRLKSILRKGIAENHFHLAGSTPLFSLSWIALMNNPQSIGQFFQNKKSVFGENRSASLSFFNDYHTFSWDKSLRYAAWIRAQLFKLINNISDPDEFNDFFRLDFDFIHSPKLSNTVLNLKLEYGALFLQPDNSLKCLDYAINKKNPNINKESNNRFLYGERELLFRCFLSCFNGKFDRNQQNLFYIYLLLKVRFRSELVQVNKEKGFANFAIYQDRKTLFWGNLQEYWIESQRLTVNASFENHSIQSLEMRLQPYPTYSRNYYVILESDQNITFADKHKGLFYAPKTGISTYKQSFSEMNELEKSQIGFNFPFFYVFHFIKEQSETEQSFTLHKRNNFLGMTSPRNSQVRHKSKDRALALARAMQHSDYLCTRIRGIDAASFEINCRPETFATEFRFLKKFVPNKQQELFLGHINRIMPKLGISYHVGEDFLDIADGLRAIDECIRFLNLSRGDRLGHALALGVDPKMHYDCKGNLIVLSKQDMLDNFVWLIMRSNEFNISINPHLRELLRNRCHQLMDDIYGECCKENHWTPKISDYYNSWKLRGDHPDCYKSIHYKPKYRLNDQFNSQDALIVRYWQAYVNPIEDETLRKKDVVSGLLHYYQYGYHERKEGLKKCSFEITSEYIQIISDLQECMQKNIAESGICIECNLSSNQLIGTFGRYENHPIFRFNSHIISNMKSNSNICVSINTDDQGVFDTSLENEYALLVDCMTKMKDENNHRIYDDETIYEYVNYIREMGILQIFPTSQSSLFYSSNIGG